MALGLQPAARPHAVEISVDVQLEQIARRVTRPAGRFRLNPGEARLGEIETIEEGVDEPDGVVRADVVVDRFRQKQKLIAFSSSPAK